MTLKKYENFNNQNLNCHMKIKVVYYEKIMFKILLHFILKSLII